MYKVIKGFTDLQDDGHVYHEGDEFPRKGAAVSDRRLAQLAGNANRRGIPLIEEVKAVKGFNSAISPVEPTEVRQEVPLQKEEKKAAPKAETQSKPKRTPGKRKKESE